MDTKLFLKQRHDERGAVYNHEEQLIFEALNGLTEMGKPSVWLQINL